MKPLIFNTTFSSYTSENVIGNGGSGRVFKCLDENGNFFALKLLNPENAGRKELIKRFKNEVLFCFNNTHPHIIKVIDFGFQLLSDQQKLPFYVMPLYSSSLRKLIDDDLGKDLVLPLYSQILDGVEAAHLKNTYHRDLKPENFLFDSLKNHLVVADFGIAHFSEQELRTTVLTDSDSRLANFLYAAPEQCKGGGEVDHHADIYALGLILNELFTKEIPRGTGFKTIGKVAPEYSYLDALVEQMMNSSPANRPNSIQEIKEFISIRSDLYLVTQKLHKISSQVVQESEIDDPLFFEPVTIKGFDWDEDKNILVLELSQKVTEKWINVLKRIGNYSSLYGRSPTQVMFSGNVAQIAANDSEVQTMVNHFKNWLINASESYRSFIQEEKRKYEDAEKQKILLEKEKQEKKKRVLESTQI